MILSLFNKNQLLVLVLVLASYLSNATLFLIVIGSLSARVPRALISLFLSFNFDSNDNNCNNDNHIINDDEDDDNDKEP